MSQTDEKKPTEAQNICLTALTDGNRQLTMSRRYLLRALDETWIRAMEEALPVLDTVIRNPQRQLREKEKVLPIEFSRNITSRSVRHLTQHTNLIAKVEGDVITPSKILNVYSDETVKTYENKFVNTLLLRLYTFVYQRCDTVLERGLDATVTTLQFSDDFSVGDTHGRVHLTLEYEEKPADGLAMRTDARYTDLWRRAQHIRSVTGAYQHSDFVRSMGQNYVRPPIIRTNAILKNKDLRQCLALWEFLEGYENAGYTLLIDRQTGILPGGAEAAMTEGISALYTKFLSDMQSAAFAEAEETVTEVPATVPAKQTRESATAPDETLRERILREVQIALAADEQYRPAEETPASEREETLFGRFRFRWSFLARLSQASDAARGYYAAVKEALLSYRKIGARISWNYETFTYGRRRCARIAVHGKTLFLYLALPPADYDRNRYHFTDASDVSAYRDVPLRLPIRSARALKYALELIGEVMNRVGTTLLPEEKRRHGGFLPRFRTLRELIADRLVRPLAGAEGAETETGEDDREEAMPEDAEAPETAAPTDDGTVTTPDEEGDDEPEERTPDGRPAPTRSPYRYSFAARLALGDETMRTRYTALAEALTAYAGVRRRATWHYDAFYYGRGTCARIGVRGKTVSVYLALAPENYRQSKYHFSDVSAVSLYRGTPMQLRVRSDRALRLACELIRDMMERLGANPAAPSKRRTHPLDVTPGSREELLAAGLIRFDGDVATPGTTAGAEPARLEAADTAETAPVAETPSVTDTVALPSPVSDTDGETMTEKPDAPETTQPADTVSAPTAEEERKAQGETTAGKETPAAPDPAFPETAVPETLEPSAVTGSRTPVTAPEEDTETSETPTEKRGFFRRLFSRHRRGNGKRGS